MSELQIQKVSHRHDAIIDWLLANPEVKNLDQLCKAMNYTRAWLSVVMNSDAFKEQYAIRRAEHNDRLGGAIAQMRLETTQKALKRLDEILDEDDLSPTFVAKTSLGLLQLLQQPQSRAVQRVEEHTKEVTTTRQVSRDVLIQARETIRTVTNVPALTYENDPTPG